ncbi:Flavin-binding monooxygenase-like protein [Necator americanus]|uniref:Flavin-containing monooxygenase n=1 Tax=Necator americanus TaxID=51031 RepID=W2SYD9_NECAM|nr:Flavin-binding monooxygenase-like protein [Necator americanus]ETN73901.1 Flavin-binding monooxygenase-like protein [Necator americanus]
MRVCVVGAGVSGLPSIKACLEEGLDVICYEKTADLGGLWNYRPGQKNIGGTVMATTVVNTSKEMMAYSDFPPPEDWPNFMHHSKVNEYLHMYAEHFGLIEHIRFNAVVTYITEEDGGYRVELENGAVEHFEKVMLCTGHHAEPLHPQLRDVEKFKGRIMHARDFQDSKGFEGKNVFLLGIGNSALDIAVDLAKIAKSVTISTRRGTWIFNKIAAGGMPYDTLYMTRWYDWLMDAIPWTVANDFMEHLVQQRMDHDLYGLRPNHRFFQQHPTVNDSLCNLICTGYISVADDFDTFTADKVIVKNGRSYDCDVFITCTGYTFGFPYLDRKILHIEHHEVPLYKFVFPPNNDNLAVIGMIQPIGSIVPISEMQARWVIQVFLGKVALPSKQAMLDDIAEKRVQMKRRYFQSEKHTIQVDYVKYMDEISSIIGCKPNISKFMWSDPRFALRLFMGANVPYVYRLEGPHKWDNAEDVIRTVPYRVKKPLKARECRMRRHKRRGLIDEYFRYVSMKWIAGWSSFIFMAGLMAFCSGTGGMSTFAYCCYVVMFFAIFSFMLLWFDLQYDMTTIL